MSTAGPLAAHAGQYLELTLPKKFYDNIPRDAPALFSTKNGTRQKRQLHSPPPPPVARSDLDQEVKRMAALLRRTLPDVASTIRNPRSWIDLYYFFDAVDLWVEGASFLYFVLSHISKDNEIAEQASIKREQNAIIFQYAGNWVAENADRIAKLPSDMDFTKFFTQSDKDQIYGFRTGELEVMKEALRFHHDHLRGRQNLAAEAQHAATPQHPVSHPAQLSEQGFAPIMQHDQPMVPHPFSALDREDQCHRMMPVHPAYPQPQTYTHFMESQRMIAAAVPNPPIAPSSFYKENGDQQRGPRARSYSSDTGRIGRSQIRGSISYGNQNHSSSNDRRVVSITSRKSPSRSTSQVNQPIYLHNFHCVTPPHVGGAPVNARLFSDPQTGRKGVSNDARLWDNSCQFPVRQSQNQHEPFEKSGSCSQSNGYSQRPRLIPFKDHPDAKITEKASTFYYMKDAMDQKMECFNNHTLYVNGADVDMFTSHALKNMMSEVGTVESISYLYTNPSCGPAFVAFTEESALQLAITRFDGSTAPSGRRLEVKFPDKNKSSRDRSGSLSTQTYFPNHYANYSGRHSSRVFRNNSTSFRQYNRSPHTSEFVMSQVIPPEVHTNQSRSRSPLTAGFQAQLIGSAPFATSIPAEQLRSCVSEVVQHHSAMDRLAQMPLDSIHNYSNKDRKLNESLRDKLQRRKKENSPLKDIPKNATPIGTPKKELNIHSAENNHKGNRSKKKGSKQNTSTNQTPAVTPVKPPSNVSLIEALKVSVHQERPAVPLNPTRSNDEFSCYGKASVMEPKDQTRVHQVSNSTMVILETPIEVDGVTLTVASREDSFRIEETAKSRKPKRNKKKQNNHRIEADDAPESQTETSAEDFSPTSTNITDYKSATTSFSEVSSRSHSFASEKSTSSLSTTNVSQRGTFDTNELFMVQNVSSTPTPIAKHSKTGSNSSCSSFSTPRPCRSHNQYRSSHVKNQSDSSELNRTSDDGTDAKSARSNCKKGADESLKSAKRDSIFSNTSMDTETPTTSLTDPEQWPALERTKTSSSIIADGKPPVITSLPPVHGRSTSVGPKNSNAVIPVLPLNMIACRRNSTDIAESHAWPRVRKCIGK